MTYLTSITPTTTIILSPGQTLTLRFSLAQLLSQFPSCQLPGHILVLGYCDAISATLAYGVNRFPLGTYNLSGVLTTANGSVGFIPRYEPTSADAGIISACVGPFGDTPGIPLPSWAGIPTTPNEVAGSIALANTGSSSITFRSNWSTIPLLVDLRSDGNAGGGTSYLTCSPAAVTLSGSATWLVSVG